MSAGNVVSAALRNNSGKMKQRARISTALVLMPLVLGVTIYGTHGLFAGLCALIILAAIWEWAALAGPRKKRWRAFVSVLTALLLTACYFNIGGVMTLFIVGLSLAWWGAALILIMRRQYGKKFSPGLILQTGIGIVVLVPAWVSMVALHADPGLPGPVLVTCLFILVWSADTGAYYVGQRWGTNKLASNVSPGKTWEGLYGALGCGLFAAVACSLLLHLTLFKSILFLLVCLITIAASVVGDLTESMIKRSGGVKDSGGLFPGHGGALDRIDSLTAAAPVFFTGVLLMGGVS